MRRIRASGGATGELLVLPRADQPAERRRQHAQVSKVFCVGRACRAGCGPPGLRPLHQAARCRSGKSRPGQIPERGVVEVKPAGDDAWLTAASDQVSRYWGLYRLVLVTNTRDFVLVGEDAQGNAVKLETFRLAESEQEFHSRLGAAARSSHAIWAPAWVSTCAGRCPTARLSSSRGT